MSSRYGFHIDVASHIMSQMYVGFLHLVAIESAEKIAVATATHVGRVHPSGVLQLFFEPRRLAFGLDKIWVDG